MVIISTQEKVNGVGNEGVSYCNFRGNLNYFSCVVGDGCMRQTKNGVFFGNDRGHDLHPF